MVVRKCTLCDREFSKLEHLKRHELARKSSLSDLCAAFDQLGSDTRQRPFECSICKKRYSRRSVTDHFTFAAWDQGLTRSSDVMNRHKKAHKQADLDTNPLVNGDQSQHPPPAPHPTATNAGSELRSIISQSSPTRQPADDVPGARNHPDGAQNIPGQVVLDHVHPIPSQPPQSTYDDFARPYDLSHPAQPGPEDEARHHQRLFLRSTYGSSAPGTETTRQLTTEQSVAAPSRPPDLPQGELPDALVGHDFHFPSSELLLADLFDLDSLPMPTPLMYRPESVISSHQGANLVGNQAGRSRASHSSGCTSQAPSHATATDPGSIKSIPLIRFLKTEHYWSVRPDRLLGSVDSLWVDLISSSKDQLFLDPEFLYSGAEAAIDLAVGKASSSALKLDESSRHRLQQRFMSREIPSTPCIESWLERQHQHQQQHQQFVGNNLCQSAALGLEVPFGDEMDMSPVSMQPTFPTKETLELLLHLYFRHFQPIFPIINRPTFVARTASSSMLCVMCLIGLTILRTEGATSFVSYYFPVRICWESLWSLTEATECLGCRHSGNEPTGSWKRVCEADCDRHDDGIPPAEPRKHDWSTYQSVPESNRN